MSMKSVWRVSISVFGIIAALGCGGAEVGEPCDNTGSQEECVDGAICDTEDDEVLCLLLCKDDSDCPDDRKCTGVSGSNLKACHPK